MSDPFIHLSIPEILLFDATRVEDAPDLCRLNQAAVDWIAGTLDTGTYQDILEEVAEVENPEGLIQTVELASFDIDWL
ncbi:hypothetical protein [Microcoleus sp. FACHB-68]|uniref:hypothetical protein n=1 Tax=Microcoleus sp. FACHB-68 TaxID=2692826 RepID=UPI001685EC92|nr:hypothetical protein [Microcoleus sp. FACHB-68]MBD1939093.1 hypothetical protein [Microcoleus sp. FACHB-68]